MKKIFILITYLYNSLILDKEKQFPVKIAISSEISVETILNFDTDKNQINFM